MWQPRSGARHAIEPMQLSECNDPFFHIQSIGERTEMATREIAGKTVQVDGEGFMTDPNDWNKEIAVELAKAEGIQELTPAHWKVIDFCRQDAGATGKSPTLRRITTQAGVSTKDLFALFPKGPAKKVAKVSGLGKPEGCV
jgi:TusE/DsrC/DsvC family sulfur relay protein